MRRSFKKNGKKKYFVSIFYYKFIIIILIMKIKMSNLVHKTLPISLSLSNFLLHSCTTRSPSLVLTTLKGHPISNSNHIKLFFSFYSWYFFSSCFSFYPHLKMLFFFFFFYLLIKVCFYVYSVVLFPLLYLLEMKSHQALRIFATSLCEETVWVEETLLHIFKGFYGLDVYFTYINKFYQFKL